MKMDQIKEKIKEIQDVFPEINTTDAFYLVLKMEGQRLFSKAHSLSNKDTDYTALETIAGTLGYVKPNPNHPMYRKLV